MINESMYWGFPAWWRVTEHCGAFLSLGFMCSLNFISSSDEHWQGQCEEARSRARVSSALCLHHASQVAYLALLEWAHSPWVEHLCAEAKGGVYHGHATHWKPWDFQPGTLVLGVRLTFTIDVSRLSNFIPEVLLFCSRVNIVRFLYSFLCVRNDTYDIWHTM